MATCLEVISALGTEVYKLAKPYLTALVATLFNATCTWAVVESKMTIVEYVTALGPTNAMIIGFWFGKEASASSAVTTESQK